MTLNVRYFNGQIRKFPRQKFPFTSFGKLSVFTILLKGVCHLIPLGRFPMEIQRYPRSWGKYLLWKLSWLCEVKITVHRTGLRFGNVSGNFVLHALHIHNEKWEGGWGICVNGVKVKDWERGKYIHTREWGV